MNEDKIFKPFCIEIWGDYACFTRPEMKVERVSYDVPTPSAVRAVFEAIFWKPAVKWQVQKIEVLSPIKFISVRRNEIGSIMSDRSTSLFIEDHRQQRAGLFLRDVHYRFYAILEYVSNENNDNAEETPGKYLAMFERRARKGQCFNQPYLGCREFSCNFKFVEDPDKEPVEPISENRDLGFMLYDMDFSNPEDPQPMFFRARLENGVVNVPSINSEEIRR